MHSNYSSYSGGTGWNKDEHAKPGYVYLIINIWRRKVKIGLSNDPNRRIGELRSVYGAWLFIFLTFKTVNMARLETLAHNKFRPSNAPEPSGMNGYTEWFWLNPIRLIAMVVFLWFKAEQIKFVEKHRTVLNFLGNLLQFVRNKLR